MDYKQFKSQATAVIAGISRQRGMEIFSIFPKSVNIKKFLVFMEDLRRQRWADDIAIFLDQLSVHRSLIVRDRADELGIPIVFNASYSPDFMPIENVFSQVKHHFR